MWDDGFAQIETAEAVAYAIEVAPPTVLGMLPVSDDIGVEEIARHIVKVTVEYTPADIKPLDPPPNPEMGTLVRRASFQAKGKFLFNPIEPIAAYDPSGDVTADWLDTLWSINAKLNGFAASLVGGMQVEPLAEVFSLDYYAPNTVITKAYLDTIAEFCSVGAFNDEDWNGYPQGSLQLVRFSLTERTPDDWDLSFGFGYKAPETNIAIGDVVIPELRGSWIYWTRTREEYNDESNIMHVYTYLAFVQRVWEERDFNLLDLPAMT